MNYQEAIEILELNGVRVMPVKKQTAEGAIVRLEVDLSRSKLITLQQIRDLLPLGTIVTHIGSLNKTIIQL